MSLRNDYMYAMASMTGTEHLYASHEPYTPPKPAAKLPENSGANYRIVNYEVARKTGESTEHLIRRFKKASFSRDGRAAREAAHDTHYEKPSAVRHRHEKEAEFREHLRAEAIKRDWG